MKIYLRDAGNSENTEFLSILSALLAFILVPFSATATSHVYYTSSQQQQRMPNDGEGH